MKIAEKMCKIACKPVFWGICGTLIGAAVAVTVVMMVLFNPLKTENENQVVQIAALQTENKQTQDKLTAANERVAVMETDIAAKQEQLEKINAEMAAVKEELGEKQAAIDKINQEMEKAKQELANNQKSLEKAKKGIEQLKNLDSLFQTYDQTLRQGVEVLDAYYSAIESGDYTQAQKSYNQYVGIAEKLNQTYAQISDLLTAFRNGGY